MLDGRGICWVKKQNILCAILYFLFSSMFLYISLGDYCELPAMSELSPPPKQPFSLSTLVFALTLLEVGFLGHISHLELLVRQWPWIKLLNLEVSGTPSAFYSVPCAHTQESFSKHCFLWLQQHHCYYADCHFQPHRQGPI